MKKYLFTTLILMFSLLSLQAQEAKSIMIKVDKASKAVSDSSFSIMGLSTCKFSKINKKIKCVERPRIKKMEFSQLNTGKDKLDSKSISILLLPSRERGIGMLNYTYEDVEKDSESWLYLSALGKVKRMASGSDDDEEASSIFGTEFTTEDMETGKIEEYAYKILKEGKLGSRPVWIIQSTPNASRLKKTRYAKTIVWIDKERYLTLKVQTYDKRNKPYKRISFSKIEKLSGHWMARSVIVINQQTSRMTRMLMEKIVLDVKMDEAFLTQRSLTDFSFREIHLKMLRKQMN